MIRDPVTAGRDDHISHHGLVERHSLTDPFADDTIEQIGLICVGEHHEKVLRQLVESTHIIPGFIDKII